ncbi:MAG: peptidylprolyl isomerase [Nostocaceae cyanobacterium]|nr:peptidylprolyl isomerase [Nostocaceae cyanobacterium]
MPEHLTISTSDIIYRLKLSCQIPEVIEAIASQAIIAETAKKAGIEVTEAELQSQGDKFRLEKEIATARETWVWLDKHHLSVKEFEELIYNSLIAKKLANHLFSAKVEKFFYENRLLYDAAVTYEIIFQNRDLALELFYALEEGEITFPEIARLYIQDPELRRAGGYQGVKYRKDFRPEIAAAVFAANSCQMLKPITTPKGVYLVWVEEIIPAELNNELRETIIDELFTHWLRKEIEFLEITTQFDADVIAREELLSHA